MDHKNNSKGRGGKSSQREKTSSSSLSSPSKQMRLDEMLQGIPSRGAEDGDGLFLSASRRGRGGRGGVGRGGKNKASEEEGLEDGRNPSGTERTVKKMRRVSIKEFSTTSLHHLFERHVKRAQEAFLKGELAEAETYAGKAIAIRPTAHLFAFMAVLSESKGQYDRASDFRLLQAFVARDRVLWEELLHEFLSEQLYFKSVVVLQRLSALERQDHEHYRRLRLQLADLLIGLGEIRRAVNVLVPLWEESGYQDFEVFSLLSSLYFQLGKLGSLESLIAGSLRYFGVAPLSELTDESGTGDAVWGVVGPSATSETTSRRRRRRRIRFMDPEDGEANDNEDTDEDEVDDNDYEDDETPHSGSSANSPFSSNDKGNKKAVGDGEPNQALSMYGSAPILLNTESKRRSFITLINVHTELLNEQGKFAETVQLVDFAAACLNIPLLEVPPDLLFRYGTACAFHGGALETPCREVFQHLMQTCTMTDYADVLMDAAGNLSKAGLWDLADEMYLVFTRYYTAELQRLERQLQEKKRELEALQPPSTPLIASLEGLHKGTSLEGAAGSTHLASAEWKVAQRNVQDLEETCKDTRLILAESWFGRAKCSAAMDLSFDGEESAEFAKEALKVHPAHVQARLFLGKHYYYNLQDLPAAMVVLTPLPDEPALNRVEFGAALVKMFRRSEKYREAIELGVSILSLIFTTPEDGDTESVAPGSYAASTRRSLLLRLPSLSRASSAIVPASSFSGMLHGPAASAASSRLGGLSHSLASSIRSTSSVFRQQLVRRGHSALTTTVYGASAAQSIATGWDREAEEEKLKDSSTIFRFNRKRRRREENTKEDGKNSGAATTATTEEAQQRRQRRREAMEALPASSFWGQDENEEADDKNGDAEPSGESEPPQAEESSPVQSKATSRKRERRPKSPPLPPLLANATTAEERELDLAELEELELLGVRGEGTAAASGEATTREGENEEEEEEEAVDYSLPPLEAVIEQFQDKDMAQLFLDATTRQWSKDDTTGAVVPVTAANDGAGEAAGGAAVAGGEMGAELSPLDQQGLGTVTLREVIRAFGRHACLDLATDIMECYCALGRLSEAKDFVAFVLTRFSSRRQSPHHRHSLERPLRLALLRASIAAGESEDAYRSGLRLLKDDTNPKDREEVLELMHGVLSRCEDRSQVLFRYIFEGNDEPALLVLLANRYYQTRSYRRALNLYLAAHSQRPTDIFLLFMIGILYFLCSRQKFMQNREACITSGMHFFTLYQERMFELLPVEGEGECQRYGEVIYNTARALQYLNQPSLCIPLYERVAYSLRVPEQCSRAIQRAARFNLYFLYRWSTGNEQLAVQSLNKEGPYAGTPSPFQ